jgi:hypothetical protein
LQMYRSSKKTRNSAAVTYGVLTILPSLTPWYLTYRN